MELVPYVSSNATTGRDEPASPFHRSVRSNVAAGLDVRIGLGSALSLTGTVNPDFGQVEVDPAVLNLSSVETFLPEKRPFFVEGSGIFTFGPPPVNAAYGFSRFVHWRRIGRQPQLSPTAAWADAPEQTTILGAAKLSGQIGKGWSLGILDASTQRETARTISASGAEGTAVTEPATNFFVGRLKRDLERGRSAVGLLATATNRAVDAVSSNSLRSAGYLVGIDGVRASRNRAWTVSASAVGSRVEGSTSAIAATQRSSVRYFNRPDAGHLSYDPARTALAGYDATATLQYRGRPLFGSLQYHATSPGYEANDLGYVSRADLRSLTAAFGASHTASAGFFRDGQAFAFAQEARNFAGNPIYRRLGVSGSSEIPSLWSIHAEGAIKPSVWSDRLTRGGPIVRIPARWEAEGGISTDSRRRILGKANVAWENNGAEGTVGELSASLTLRPSPSLQLSVGPSLILTREEAQYVRTVADVTALTFGHRYVFASLDQRTLSADARVDWTLTPALSVQFFSQPFSARSSFRDYKQLHLAGTFDFDVFGRSVGTATRLPGGRTAIDPDGSGPAPSFTVGDNRSERSFVARALRANAVMRWEYRPGSLLYLVWQQARDGEFDLLESADGRVPGLWAVRPTNVLLLKASYRLGR